MDEEGYTFVKLKITKQCMRQEYVQFSVESLEKIVELINSTNSELYEFWERRNDIFYKRV